MSTWKRLRCKPCLIAVFATSLVLVLLHVTGVIELGIDKTVRSFEKVGNIMTVDKEWTHQSNRDDSEIGKQERITIFNETGDNMDAACVPLFVSELQYRTRICIYNTSDDWYVSGSLQKTGALERDIMKGLGLQLKALPDAIFVDVGSNVGAYTMQATALGHKVIAIDPLRTNLQLLSKSVRLARQEENVVLLWNAVSNVHETVTLRLMKHNIGTTHIVQAGGKGWKNSISAANYTVLTILLEDLVDRFQLKSKTVVMKMDIEGSELIALLGASKLFRYNTVCFVSMELVHAQMKGTVKPIVEVMRSYGFELFDDPLMTKSVGNDLTSLGNDGFFRNKKCV